MSLRPTPLLALMIVACTSKEPPDTDDSGATDTDTTDTDTTDTIGDDDDDDDDDDGPLFDAHLIDPIENPAHATVGDMDNDGRLEIIVSSLGAITGADIPPGLVSIYTRGADLATWTREDVVTTAAGVEFPGNPTPYDVDGDGDLDIILPSGGIFCEALPKVGPCGGMAWMENPGGSGTWAPHVIVNNSPWFYVAVAVADIDGDGNEDWITVGERVNTEIRTSEVHMYRGLGGGAFENSPSVLATGAAPWPELTDLDNDGDLDLLVGGRYEPFPAFAWLSHDGGPVWTPHTIDDTLARGFMIRPVPDLFGDGVVRMVATNHTNTVAKVDPDTVESVVVAFDVPNDPLDTWPAPTVLSTGIEALPEIPGLPNEAPGTFAPGDIDGDGDQDLVVAGDGAPSVFLLEQTAPGTFETRILRDGVRLTGGTNVVDLDGDGDVEIVCVTNYDNAVYVIEYNGN